jgi:hypothetical protein
MLTEIPDTDRLSLTAFDRALAHCRLTGYERMLVQFVREWCLADTLPLNLKALSRLWRVPRRRLTEAKSGLIRDGLLISQGGHYRLNRDIDTWPAERLCLPSRFYAFASLAAIRMAAFSSPEGPSDSPRKIPHGLRTSVFERDAYRCRLCGGHVSLTIDHIIPECQGGPTTLDNLQTLCRPCNSRKAGTMPE